jgi:predicted N-acetyltransferase YhbS
MPAHPIGVVLPARLAIDRSLQGQGYGRALVRMLRCERSKRPS